VTYTIGELFAGIGGFSLAFHATGQARTAWFVEKEPYCQQVLHKHWPTVPIFGDIYDCHDLPHVDVITAGFPCQPFSLAGKRQGEQDERYLIPEMFRVIQEVRPNVVLFENVPGFASIAVGDTFKQFLRALADMGFDAQWGHLAAAHVGAPHKRERWFCVAYRAGHRYQHWATDEKRSLSQFNGLSETAQNGMEKRGHSTVERGSSSVVNTHKTGWRKQRRAITVQQEFATTQHTGRMGNATNIRRKQHQSFAQSVGTRKDNRRLLQSQGTSYGSVEPRLGGNFDGLPARLDGHQWPARPGQAQFDWEPLRTTQRKDQRANRLKALGNAVVPQVVLPIATAIVEWLDTQSQTGQEEKIA